VAKFFLKVLRTFASLQLTVILLAFALVLVFVGTLAQRNMDIYAAQKMFFRSWFIIPPIPGGFTLGLLLLVNLIAAQITRFKITWAHSGIFITHIGLIVLLLGELVTTFFAVESQMTLDTGQTKNYAESYRDPELAITWASAEPGLDNVIAVPTGMLQNRHTIAHPPLPFTIRVERWFGNSQILGPMQAGTRKPQATQGLGSQIVVEKMEPNRDPEGSDVPSALVRLRLRANNQDLGLWLVSYYLNEPQAVTVGDQTFYLALRSQRHYKPYQIKLLEFQHEKYQGVDIPMRFESRVQLTDPAADLSREQRIYMNHPLRYAGDVFYQSGFGNNDQTSILLVVNNPGWLMPYASSTLIGLGLLVQFLISLVNFAWRKAA